MTTSAQYLEDVAALAGTRWQLDAGASSAAFRVKHFWGLATVKGAFGKLDGRLEVDDHERWHMELSIEAGSLDTGNRKRDEHLRSKDFFAVDQHPDVRFRSTAVIPAEDGQLRVAGELEAAGRRTALRFAAQITRAGRELRIDARTTVDQRDLGMTWSPLGIARTPTTLIVHARMRPAR